MVDNDFFIREDQILEGLTLQKTELDSIINTLTKSEKFDFEDGVHFCYVNKKQKIREYARLALLTVLANYYESEGDLKQLKKVVDLSKKLVSEKEQKEIDNEITETTIEVINDSSNQILYKDNRHWLNYRDVKTILKTTFNRLEQAFQDITRSDFPLIIGEDFEDIEVKNNYERHYSFSGLERICLEFSQKLTRKYRRLYTSRVPEIAPDVINQKAQLRLPQKGEIESAKKLALKQQDNKCQVTGKSRSETYLAVHHLYSQNTYPELASDQDNLFVISDEVHRDFHTEHQGGTIKPCTVNDFIDFIKKTTRYGETHEALARLDDRKRSLEQKIKNKFQLLPSSSTLTVIDLSARCGGMALGLETAGLEIKLLVETDKNSFKTLRQNRPQWNIENQNVATIDFTKYEKQIDIVIIGQIDIAIIGNVRDKAKFSDAETEILYDKAIIECIKQVKPKIIIGENVKALISGTRGSQILDLISNTFDELGYQTSYKLLDAQYFNVPQKRERILTIGIRKDLNIQPTFPDRNNQIVTLKEALENCPQSEGYPCNEKYKEILELIPEGGKWNRRMLSEIGNLQDKYTQTQLNDIQRFKRLSYNETCTIPVNHSVMQYNYYHPTETRPLTIRELARIKTFPDDWEFIGELDSQYKQILNAVPVNLAFSLGKHLLKLLV